MLRAIIVRELRSKGCRSPDYQSERTKLGPCCLCGGLDKVCLVVSTALLVRVQCFRKSLHMAVEGPSTRPIVFSVIPGSYCRRRRSFTILVPEAMKSAPDPSKFVNKITVKHWVGDSFCYIFLKRYSTKF